MKRTIKTAFIAASCCAAAHAAVITTDSMVGKTYYCAVPQEIGVMDISLLDTGILVHKPLAVFPGDGMIYRIQNSSTLLIDNQETWTLSNATETSFTMTPGNSTPVNCFDNFEDAFAMTDVVLPHAATAAIVLDGNAAEWSGITDQLDASRTTGSPIDITTMKVAKDADYVYVLVQTDKDISTFLPNTDPVTGWINTFWMHLNTIEIGTQNNSATEWREAWPEGVRYALADGGNQLAGQAEMVISGNTVEAKFPRSALESSEYAYVSASFGIDDPSSVMENADETIYDEVEGGVRVTDVPHTTDGTTPDASLLLNTDNLAGVALFCTGDIPFESVKLSADGTYYVNSFVAEWLDHGNYTITDIDTMSFDGFILDLTEITASSVRVTHTGDADAFSALCYRTFAEALAHEKTLTDLLPKVTPSIDGQTATWGNTLAVTADSQTGSPIDITQINLSKDDDYVYMMIQTDTPITEFMPGQDGNGNFYQLQVSVNERFQINGDGNSIWVNYSVPNFYFMQDPNVMGMTYAVNGTVLQAKIPKDMVGPYMQLGVAFTAVDPNTYDTVYTIDSEKKNVFVEDFAQHSNVSPAVLMYLLN